MGRVGDTLVYIEIEISERGRSAKVWVLGVIEGMRERVKPWVKPLFEKLATMNAEVLARVQPPLLWTKSKVVSIAGPYWIKAKDGSMHLKMQVGNSIVYVRTGITTTYGRVSSKAMAVYDKAYQAVAPYVTPVLDKAVALYRQIL